MNNNLIIIEETTHPHLLQAILVSCFAGLLAYSLIRLFQTLNRNALLETAESMIFDGRRNRGHKPEDIILSDNTVLDKKLVERHINKNRKRFDPVPVVEKEKARAVERKNRKIKAEEKKRDKYIEKYSAGRDINDIREELIQKNWELEDIFEIAKGYFVFMPESEENDMKKGDKKRAGSRSKKVK